MRILITFILFAMSASLYAQYNANKIYLHNGRVELGTIIESSSGQSVSLQKGAERILVFDRSDIDKIVNNSNGSNSNNSEDEWENNNSSDDGWGNSDIPAVYMPVKHDITNSQGKEEDKVFKDYDRNSVSFLMITHNDLLDNRIMKSYVNQPFDKYDQNELPANQLPANFGRDANININDKAQELTEFFNNKNLGKKIISYWYNRKKDGSMDLFRVYDRGMYNASDRILTQALATYDGFQKIKDDAVKLIKKSYIIVFDVRDIKYTISKAGILTWTGVVDTYLFSVVFDDQIKQMINDCWFGTDDNYSQAEKAKKKEEFNNIPFKVKYELQTSAYVSPNETMAMLNGFNDALNANNVQQIYYGDGSAEFPDFMNRTFTSAMTSLENVRPDFIVKTAVDSINPVQAKIGKKEGLRRNQKYEVYQLVLNTENKKQEAKKVAVLRATKIIDNRSVTKENSGLSKFTIIDQQAKIEKSMYMQQKNDKKLTVYGDILAGKNIQNIALGMGKMNFICTNSFSGSLLMDITLLFNKEGDNQNEVNKNFTFCFRLGYEFGFNVFTPNIKIAPFATGGFGISPNDGQTVDPYTGVKSSGSMKGIYSFGSKLIYNLKYPMQIYLKAEILRISSSIVNYPNYGLGIQYTF